MTSIHAGHRRRVRERYMANGLEGFAPHEVLELLLFYARARGDVNPLAHALLQEFGSLHGVLEASPEQLMCVKGVGEETATLLSMIVPLFRRYQTSRATDKVQLSGYRELADYCLSLLSGLRMERFCAVMMDGNYRLLGVKVISEGSIDRVEAYPRRVVEAALNYNASRVVLCHNHPSGTLAPSPADIDCTRDILRALSAVNIVLLDHVIVADDRTCSMSMRGDLTRLEKQEGMRR